MNDALKFVYITAPTTEVANTIGRHLLEKRLAACINCFPQMNSLYWWQGKIETGSEVVVIAKTVTSKVEALIAEVEKIHPYTVPCALVLNVDSGSTGYISWLKQNLGD